MKMLTIRLYFKQNNWTEVVAQWEKHLLCKHEVLSFGSQMLYCASFNSSTLHVDKGETRFSSLMQASYPGIHKGEQENVSERTGSGNCLLSHRYAVTHVCLHTDI